MEDGPSEEWLTSIVEMQSGYEYDAVERFADRLIRFAKVQMPLRVRQRVDPEDIVQSVFRSFFARHTNDRFEFREAEDVWRLLAAITYRKVLRSIRFHQQQQRDVRNETIEPESGQAVAIDNAPTSSSLVVMMDLLDEILAQLPERHQKILSLRLEGYSVDEIAEQVSVSSRTVDRALALVRQIATEIVDDE